MNRVDELLQVLRDAWNNVLKGMKEGVYVHTNESDIRCLLFHECSKLLEQRGYKVFVISDYKVDDKRVDLALLPPITDSVDEDHIIAVEIKYDPAPSKIEADLLKLRELLDKGTAVRGVFLTLACSEYGLRERLERRGIFQKFTFRDVEWHSLRRPWGRHKHIDALLLVL